MEGGRGAHSRTSRRLEPPACPAWPGRPGDPQLVAQLWVSVTLSHKHVGSCLYFCHPRGALGVLAGTQLWLFSGGGSPTRTRAPARGPSGRLGGDSWDLVPKSLCRWLNEIVVKEDAAGEQVGRLGLDRLGCSQPFHNRLEQGGQRPEALGDGGGRPTSCCSHSLGQAV